MSDVVVLGGGIVGLSATRALQQDGHAVTVVDSGNAASGATTCNAGWVCPSQVGPLAAPGMLRGAARMLLRRSSPLYVAPRADPQLARFLAAFAFRCRAGSYRDALAALNGLAAAVDSDFEGLEQDLSASGRAVPRRRSEVLYCFLDRRHAERAHEHWQPRAGLAPGPVLDGDQVREVEPALADAVGGGFLLPGDAYVDPEELALALLALVRARGAAVLEQAGATAVLLEGARVVGVRTAAHGVLPADEVVVAAGAGSAGHLRALGIRIPLVPGMGYRFTVDAAVPLRSPICLEEAHVVLTPLPVGLRVAGTMELSGRTAGVDQRRVSAIARSAAPYLHGIAWSARRDVRGAARPLTPDGLPVVGRPAGVHGCVVATGHGMYGLTLAPTTARIVAAAVRGEPTPPALSPDRVLSRAPETAAA